MNSRFLLQVACKHLVRCKPAMNNRFPSWYNVMKQRNEKKKGYHQLPFNLQENRNFKVPQHAAAPVKPPMNN